MAKLALPLLFFGAAVSAAPGVADFALFYTDAHDKDPDAFSAPRRASSARGAGVPCSGGGMLPFWLQRAFFTREGALLEKPVDVTTEQCGMGYLSLHPLNKSTVLLATTDLVTPGNVGNIETYTVDLTLPLPIAPRRLFTDISALLLPCQAALPHPCVAANTFHARWTPDGQSIVFAYRAWTAEGDGIGNQALAISDASGANIRVLTFTTAGQFSGINIFDSCPSPSRDGSRIFFSRSEDQGASSYASLVDVASGEVSIMHHLPVIAVSSGCPNFVDTLDGVSVLYMGCNGSVPDSGCTFAGPAREARQVKASRSDPRAGWGDASGQLLGKHAALAEGEGIFTYGRVELTRGTPTSQLRWQPMFGVSLTSTPSSVDSYATTQCDQILGLAPAKEPAVLSCEGADPAKIFFQLTFVDASNGNATAVSRDTFSACMTPRCSLLTRVEDF